MLICHFNTIANGVVMETCRLASWMSTDAMCSPCLREGITDLANYLPINFWNMKALEGGFKSKIGLGFDTEKRVEETPCLEPVLRRYWYNDSLRQELAQDTLQS